MRVLKEIEVTRKLVRSLQQEGRSVGLVPTMGALHDGHLSLITAARRRCSAVAVTIFVNPTQFGPGEDLEGYPRPLEDDLLACEKEGVDLVFAPAADVMYAGDACTTVHVSGLTAGLCGRSRPVHFDGVATVVTKLFNIVPADVAFFGEKDYQQLQVIRRVVRDLDIPIEIAACPTVREADGLAMSSRNAYLSPSQRRQAASLNRGLLAARARVESGDSDVPTVIGVIEREIHSAGPAEIDYIEVVDPVSLAPLERIDKPARICLAVTIGTCRLIDNLAVEPT